MNFGYFKNGVSVCNFATENPEGDRGQLIAASLLGSNGLQQSSKKRLPTDGHIRHKYGYLPNYRL